MKLFRIFATLCFLLTVVPALGTGTVTFFQESTTAEQSAIGSADNPAISGFPLRNKQTGDIYYFGGHAVTFNHPVAISVRVTSSGGVAQAIQRRILYTGTGLTMFGGRGRTFTTIGGGLECFFILREPGTLTITVIDNDGNEHVQTAHYRCPTPAEIESKFRPQGHLNHDLVEVITWEDERRSWEGGAEEVPAETLEDILKAIEDAVDRLRAHPGVVN